MGLTEEAVESTQEGESPKIGTGTQPSNQLKFSIERILQKQNDSFDAKMTKKIWENVQLSMNSLASQQQQVKTIQNVGPDPNTSTNDSIQATNQMPSMVTFAPEKTTAKSAKFKCPDCPYSSNKKHTLKVHCEEFCKNQKNLANKDRTCKYCLKQYTRNGLRVHLNQFVKQTHTPKGGHAIVTLSQHKAYLDEIKASH